MFHLALPRATKKECVRNPGIVTIRSGHNHMILFLNIIPVLLPSGQAHNQRCGLPSFPSGNVVNAVILRGALVL